MKTLVNCFLHTKLFLGEIAKKKFVNLKKRYNKRKNSLYKAEKFGGSATAISSAREKLKEYRFLAWVDPFIRPRSLKYYPPKTHESAVASTTENMPNKDDNCEVPDSWEADDSNDFSDVGSVSSVNGTAPTSHERKRPTKNPTSGRKKCRAGKWTRDEVEYSVMSNVRTAMKTSEHEEKTDEEGLFGRLVASDLRKLSSFSKMIAKNKIQNLLFELQMQEHNQLQGPQQSATNSLE